MYPTYSCKNGRKYHYYVSKSESRFGAPGKSYERLPAPEIVVACLNGTRDTPTLDRLLRMRIAFEWMQQRKNPPCPRHPFDCPRSR